MISSRTFDAHMVLCAMVLCSLLTQRAIAAEDDGFFEKQVRPLLIKRCYKCHSGTKTNGGLALDSRAGSQRGGETGPAIIPGKPESSLLVKAINYDGLEMPPKESGGKLSAAEISVLTEWVKRGANDPRIEAVRPGGMTNDQARSWWAFQSLPNLTEPVTPKGIDRFIDAQLKASSLVPQGQRALWITWGR